MNIKSKILLSMTMVLVLVLVPISVDKQEVHAEVVTGKKENVSWVFDNKTGILTFSGSGPISEDWQSDIEEYGSKIKKVKIEEGITGIGREAFQWCNELLDVEIPESVTRIDQSAFQGCKSIKKIQIPQNVSYIGKYAFWGCISLESINIPDKVEKINDATFPYCISLTYIDIPNNVISIGEIAFLGCIALEKITIQNDFTVIKFGAFKDCSNLKIYCNKGSLAEKYAKENNIKCISGNQEMISWIIPIVIFIVVILIGTVMFALYKRRNH